MRAGGTVAYKIPLVWYEVDNCEPFQNTAVVGVNPLPSAIAVNPGLPAGTGSLKVVSVITGSGGGFGGDEEPALHPSVDSVIHKGIMKDVIASNRINIVESFMTEGQNSLATWSVITMHWCTSFRNTNGLPHDVEDCSLTSTCRRCSQSKCPGSIATPVLE